MVTPTKLGITLILLIVCLFNVVSGLSTPYSLSGHIYDSNGVTPIVGANITFTNQNSSEIIYCDSTTNGEYQQDAANFPSGYYDGDVIRYYAVYGSQNNTTTAAIVVSGGGTSLDIVLSSGAAPTPTPVPITTTISVSCLCDIFLFLGLLLMALIMLLYSWLAPEKFYYTDVIAALLSGVMFFVLAYYSLGILEYAWLGLLMLMFGIVQVVLVVVKIIDALRKAVRA